jgi:stringent starvation protein B
MVERSTKPYLIRAVHEWAIDSGFTPYLSVKVDAQTRVPMEFVKNGEIVLNLSYDATHQLKIGNEAVQFAARFGGVSRECSIPMAAVQGIFARENGQGMFFSAEPATDDAASVAPEPDVSEASPSPDDPKPGAPAPGGRPRLQVVK